MKNENQKSVISFIYSYYKTHYIYIFFLILFLCAIGSYYIIDGFLKKSLIDNLVKINNIKEISVVKKKVFIVFIAMIISFSFYYIFWLLIHMIHIKIVPKVRNNITRDCFLRVQSQSFNFFQKNLSGSLSYNIFSLGENIQLLIHKYLPYFLLRFSQIFFSLWAIRFIDPIFLIIFAVWFIIFFIFSFIFMKKFRIASKDYADTSAYTSGKITDSVSNFFNIKIFASLIFEKKNK